MRRTIKVEGSMGATTEARAADVHGADLHAKNGQMPTPELFFATAQAYQQTAALKAALELDVFTAIAEGAESADSIARRCRTSERGMRILCDFLVIIGFLTKNRQTHGYQLTPDRAMFLDRRSPAYL